MANKVVLHIPQGSPIAKMSEAELNKLAKQIAADITAAGVAVKHGPAEKPAATEKAAADAITVSGTASYTGGKPGGSVTVGWSRGC